MVQALGFYIFYGIARILAFFPFGILYAFSGIIYGLVFYVIGYRKKVVMSNLRNAFPHKNEEERRQIAKRFYQHLADLVIEVIKMLNMSQSELNKRITYEGLEYFQQAYENNRHIICCIAHYGNWEWLSGLAHHIPHKSYTVYKPLHNNYFDAFMYQLRKKFGVDLLPFQQTFRILLQDYNANRLTATGFIADQTPKREEIGYWTNFLHQDTPWYTGMEKLARKMNAMVVFFHVVKVKRGYYEVRIKKLFNESQNQPEGAIIEQYARTLEKVIQEEPAYWLWSHRRWKRQRKMENNLSGGS